VMDQDTAAEEAEATFMLELVGGWRPKLLRLLRRIQRSAHPCRMARPPLQKAMHPSNAVVERFDF